MVDYLAFVYGGLSEPSGNALKDGESLADQCLRRLNAVDSKDKFPPRLLILLASPAYLDQQKAEQLLKGVCKTFNQTREKIELIGSSVGGVFFNQQVHPNGALLVCLASKLIEANVAYGANARQNPKGAITDLLSDLELDPSRQIDPNPLANRLILTFLPGCSQDASNEGFYPAPELHSRLYEGVQARITLIGGVSSANDPSRKTDGLQFAGQQVLRDSVVAASIVTGVPVGVSLNDGLLSTGKILRVTKLDADKRTVLEFNGYSPREQLGPAGGDLMLAKFSADDERIVDIPLLTADGAVQLLRQPKLNDYFEVLERQPASKIFKITQDGITQAKRRVFVERPIASLLFPCRAYIPRHENSVLNVETALAQIEKDLENGPCVGGFFDGALGVDETGRSRLINGGVGYVIFGDEIRERTALYKGVSALTEHEPKVLAGSESELTPASIYEAIDNALNIVDETGFPGAMISLVRFNLDRTSNEAKEFIIAYKAVGPRFLKIVDHTQRPCEGDDILAIVFREKKARFIPDSRSEDSHCDQEAIKLSGLISQYVLPLKGLGNTVLATLQVDVGDLSRLSEEDFCKTEKARMLDCFAEVIGASINRIASAIENNIMGRLDAALKNSLSDSLSDISVHEGLDKFIKAAGEAFGAERGHLWLVRLDDSAEASTDQILILETGFGVDDEPEKKSWREIHVNNFSPICCAFLSNDPQIVNDVSNDRAWQTMLEGIPREAELFKSLSRIKSYAAVAFKDEQGESLGAVSFCSTEPWFFLGFHRNALEVLAERIGFLVEHLRAKIRLKFLSDVSPRLAERNLSEAETILQNVTDDFRLALKADVASLYLWDQDRKKYILRAQSNWDDDGWVHAASYSKVSGWIGVTAINKEPFHVADLYKYYVEQGYNRPDGRYAKYMFGQPLSETFTVEAIGLPLRIGLKKTDKFGVLTLYRRVKKEETNGFATTDIQLLQKGAYNAAGLVNAVLRHREDMWEKEEDKRRQEVYEAINSSDDDESFEAKVCCEVIKQFHAAEVAFYRVVESDIVKSPSWITGYRRRPGTEEAEKMGVAPAEHLKIIKKSTRSTRNKRLYQVASERRKLKKREREDPEAAKLEKLVEQVCIPLLGDNKYLAALVVRWRLSPKIAFSPEVQHNAAHLQRLGHIIGSAYLRRRMKRQAEQSQLAVQTAGIYVFQHAHRLGNAIQGLYSIAQTIRSARNESERAIKVTELETTATNNIKDIEWIVNLGELVQNPAREPLSLYDLIQESWQEVVVSGDQTDALAFSIDREITVIADPKLTKEVFINLMNNAMEAMKSKKEQTGGMTRLRVNAVVSENEEIVKITFKDNGVGMTPQQIDDAEKGFVPTKRQYLNIRHKGVGVLISRYLLRVQGGSLLYKSALGEGTEAIVTLPHLQIGRRRNGMANAD
jgi:signal transduction histidine kinase